MTAIERFLQYVTYGTASDEGSETCPSTPSQKVLGARLVQDLAEIGMQDAHMDEDGYVYAFLPATPGRENHKKLGFVAHMDTSPDASGDNVKPRVITYGGGDITLENGDVVKPADYPFLAEYVGQELIVTDGTTQIGRAHV